MSNVSFAAPADPVPSQSESIGLANQTSPPETVTTPRLLSIDVFRGWVMFLMLAHAAGFCKVSANLPESSFWKFLCFHWSHVPWRGMSLHDLIQPGFSFLVGTSLAFSIASRKRRGLKDRNLLLHAVWRSLVLIMLGIFLRSLDREQTYWTFEDTLTQIGLGYLPLILIAIAPPVATWVSITVILVGYWLAFGIYPLPPANFDYASVGVGTGWPHHETGWAAHWNKNSNLAWWFDTWFLNLFPIASGKPFQFNGGGYSTLSFIPTLGTMLLGLVAGRWLRDQHATNGALVKLALAAVACLSVGYFLDATGLCPSVKRIWTPAWVLVSGGWCFLILGVLHLVCERIGYRVWAFPLVIFGVNSIAAYVMEWLMPAFTKRFFQTHLGPDWSTVVAGPIYKSLIEGVVVVSVIWLILLWMHRRRLYIKI